MAEAKEVTQRTSALLVAISGPSSSGKTTLSRFLRDMLQPHAFILHEDDFYKTDGDIPVHSGVQDWDCAESVDLALLQKTLTFVREHGHLPVDFESKEDKNAVGTHGVQDVIIAECASRLQAQLAELHWTRPIAIIDGFLLFADAVREVRDEFDARLFLRTSYAAAKGRREARSGYVTIEGFWEDPPGYVDTIMWPNYVLDHAFLFENGDVEGNIDENACNRLDINAMPKACQGSMADVLRWATDVIEGILKSNSALLLLR